MVPNALVLVADRMGCGYLGPYGNTWIETPGWNRLAVQGTLFETALVDSPELLKLYQAYWHGEHAMATTQRAAMPSLAELLAPQGIETWLITDERLVAEQEEAQAFAQRVVLPAGDEQTVESIEQTQLARIFATLLDVLSKARSPFLIWVHAQAMQAPWDAPYPLRAQLVEQEDPDPPHWTQPPEIQLEPDFDPDLLLGIQQAYGAQVSVLDACLEILLDAWSGSSWGSSTALVATAARGYPLGEHAYVGRAELPLVGELLQVPWIIRRPDAAGALWRGGHFVQPPDLFATLLDWFAVPPSEIPSWGRSLLRLDEMAPTSSDQLVACAQHAAERAIRVPAWYLRQIGQQDAHLYAKPDDRWEFNEIANRCRSVVEELTQLTEQFAAAVNQQQREALPDLSDVLRVGLG